MINVQDAAHVHLPPELWGDVIRHLAFAEPFSEQTPNLKPLKSLRGSCRTLRTIVDNSSLLFRTVTLFPQTFIRCLLGISKHELFCRQLEILKIRINLPYAQKSEQDQTDPSELRGSFEKLVNVRALLCTFTKFDADFETLDEMLELIFHVWTRSSIPIIELELVSIPAKTMRRLEMVYCDDKGQHLALPLLQRLSFNFSLPNEGMDEVDEEAVKATLRYLEDLLHLTPKLKVLEADLIRIYRGLPPRNQIPHEFSLNVGKVSSQSLSHLRLHGCLCSGLASFLEANSNQLLNVQFSNIYLHNQNWAHVSRLLPTYQLDGSPNPDVGFFTVSDDSGSWEVDHLAES